MQRPPSSAPPLLRRLRDVVVLALGSGMAQLASLLALPLLQKSYYGPEAFADMAAYSQLVGIVGAIAAFRMDLAIVKSPDDPSARASTSNGLRALMATTLGALLLACILDFGGWAMGDIPWLALLLPLGVAGMGINGLLTGWLARTNQFGSLAWTRAGGTVLGEASRFVLSAFGGAGLIAGRLAGQWCTALACVWKLIPTWKSLPKINSQDRKAAWARDWDYVRFTTPANVLAMAANGAFIFFLFETCTPDLVGNVGAGMAYLTVAAGLVIRSVNDVFFKHLDDIPQDRLLQQYWGWAGCLMVLTVLGLSTLWWIPESWVETQLGAAWSDMLPVMRLLAPWMVPWIAASALSGIFPHLGLQSWSLALDALHLLVIAGLVILTLPLLQNGALTDADAWQFLRQYTVAQSAFYFLALAAGTAAIRSRRG